MKLFSYVDETDLKKQIEDGMIKEQLHPRAPLTILNYTPKAQFTPEGWTETTDKCRGLIYNTNTLEIVARPFVKFWNFNDSRHPETMSDNLPTSLPLITRKMDGSMGVGYKNPENGQWEIATCGSFTSDQATWATKWARGDMFWSEDYTPIYEIIYPENRIVVDYKGWSGLVLLALVDNETGEEVSYGNLRAAAAAMGIQVVKEFAPPLSDHLAEDDPDEEGYVVSWAREGTYPLRVKIKYETYCKLHRIMTQTSAIGIWEMLRDRQSLDTLYDNTPNEFKAWAKATADGLQAKALDLETRANAAFEAYGEVLVRADFAAYAKFMSPLTPLLFARLDGKDLHPIIWKTIRPSGVSKPFYTEEAA